MYNYLGGLALAVQTLVGLLVQLQRPVEPKPDDVVATLLEVQTVCAACGMCQQDVDFTAVPGGLVGRPRQPADPEPGSGQAVSTRDSVKLNSL